MWGQDRGKKVKKTPERVAYFSSNSDLEKKAGRDDGEEKRES